MTQEITKENEQQNTNTNPAATVQPSGGNPAGAGGDTTGNKNLANFRSLAALVPGGEAALSAAKAQAQPANDIQKDGAQSGAVQPPVNEILTQGPGADVHSGRQEPLIGNHQSDTSPGGSDWGDDLAGGGAGNPGDPASGNNTISDPELSRLEQEAFAGILGDSGPAGVIGALGALVANIAGVEKPDPDRYRLDPKLEGSVNAVVVYVEKRYLNNTGVGIIDWLMAHKMDIAIFVVMGMVFKHLWTQTNRDLAEQKQQKALEEAVPA